MKNHQEEIDYAEDNCVHNVNRWACVTCFEEPCDCGCHMPGVGRYHDIEGEECCTPETCNRMEEANNKEGNMDDKADLIEKLRRVQEDAAARMAPKVRPESRVLDIIEEGEVGVHQPELYVVAGTGSRSLQTASREDKLNAINLVDAELVRLMETHGDNLVVMSGMAEGFDKLLAMRAIHHGIKLWCAIPNKGYGRYYWGKHSLTGHNVMSQFKDIVDGAWRVTLVMEDVHNLQGIYGPGGKHSNFLRNDYMVEQGDEFLVWDPSSSGTKDCFKSIIKSKKPYTVLTK
jgi:hypothetical protein